MLVRLGVGKDLSSPINTQRGDDLMLIIAIMGGKNVGYSIAL